MIPSLIIGLLIFSYGAYQIRKKVLDIKNGKFCSCGCGGCVKNCAGRIPEEGEV